MMPAIRPLSANRAGPEKPALGRRPERVPAGIQQPANFLLKWRNPSGIPGIEFPGRSMKSSVPNLVPQQRISMPAVSVPIETGFSI